MSEQFKAGDEVAVFSSGGFGQFAFAPHKICKVARVMRRFLELEDGSKWSLDGRIYSYRAFALAHISLVTDDNRKELVRISTWYKIEPLLDKISKKPQLLSLEQMQSMLNLLKSCVKEN